MLAFIYCLKHDVFSKISFLPTYDLQKLLRYSLLAFSGNIIFFLVYRVDYWFVNTYCTITELGNYIQVSKLAQVFMLMPTTIASAIFINTASKKEQEVESLKTISRLVTLLYFLMIAIIILSGKWLFPFIYGETFTFMYYPFLLLSPGIISLSTLALLTSFYAGRGKMIINIKGSFCALFLILILNFIFTPKYGIYAAAASSTAAYILYHMYVIYMFKQEYKNTSITDFFIFQKSDLKFFKRSAMDYEKN